MSTNSAVPGCGFHHVAIRAKDFDKSVAFYTEVLGFREYIAWGEKPTRATMLDTGDGNHLEIFERTQQAAPSEDPPPAILHFCLRTTDTRGVVEKVRATGAEITTEPKVVEIQSTPAQLTVTLAFFKGPDGEIIELIESDGLPGESR